MMDEEEDLWFLPGPPEDSAPTDLPWPMAHQGAVFEPRDWLRAEQANARGLVAAASAFARLDERMRRAPKGVSQRLAQDEAVQLLWAEGARLEREKLALYHVLREGALDEARALAAGDWAVRRLTGGLSPDDLGAFLGRRMVETDGLAEVASRAVGAEFAALSQDWHAALALLEPAHPLTRAAGAFAAWQVYGLSEPGDVLEAGVTAARIGAAGARGMRFVPLGARYITAQGGPAQERLANWYRMVENACYQALMTLDTIEDWQARARDGSGDLSGRVAPCLVAAMAGQGVISAAMLADLCGCSRAAARRNLAIFQRRGLLREVTGQGRYRFWAMG